MLFEGANRTKIGKTNRMCVSACFMDDTVPHHSSYSRVEAEV